MSGPDAGGNISIQLGPFNDPAQKVKAVDFVIHYNNNTWNNNGGADFHIPISEVVTGLDEPDPKNRMSVWPVPATTRLYVGVPVELTEGSRLQLDSAAGKVETDVPVYAENFTLPVGSLVRGVFIVRILNKEGRMVAFMKVVLV